MGWTGLAQETPGIGKVKRSSSSESGIRGKEKGSLDEHRSRRSSYSSGGKTHGSGGKTLTAISNVLHKLGHRRSHTPTPDVAPQKHASRDVLRDRTEPEVRRGDPKRKSGKGSRLSWPGAMPESQQQETKPAPESYRKPARPRPQRTSSMLADRQQRPPSFALPENYTSEVIRGGPKLWTAQLKRSHSLSHRTTVSQYAVMGESVRRRQVSRSQSVSHVTKNRRSLDQMASHFLACSSLVQMSHRFIELSLDANNNMGAGIRKRNDVMERDDLIGEAGSENEANDKKRGKTQTTGSDDIEESVTSEGTSATETEKRPKGKRRLFFIGEKESTDQDHSGRGFTRYDV